MFLARRALSSERHLIKRAFTSVNTNEWTNKVKREYKEPTKDFEEDFYKLLRVHPTTAFEFIVRELSQCDDDPTFFAWSCKTLKKLSSSSQPEYAIRASLGILEQTTNSASISAAFSALGETMIQRPQRLLLIYEQLKIIANQKNDEENKLLEPLLLFTYYKGPISNLHFEKLLKYVENEKSSFRAKASLIEYLGDFGTHPGARNLMDSLISVAKKTKEPSIQHSIIKTVGTLAKHHTDGIGLLISLYQKTDLKGRLMIHSSICKALRKDPHCLIRYSNLDNYITKINENRSIDFSAALDELPELLASAKYSPPGSLFSDIFSDLFEPIVEFAKLHKPEFIYDCLYTWLKDQPTRVEADNDDYRMKAVCYVFNRLLGGQVFAAHSLVQRLQVDNPPLAAKLTDAMVEVIPPPWSVESSWPEQTQEPVKPRIF